MTDQIRKIQIISDQAQGAWYNVFEAPGIDGKPVRAIILREVQEPRRVARELLNAGAAISTEDDDCALIAAAIREDAPIVHRRAQVGWLPERTAFVSTLHVATHPSHLVTYQPPEQSESSVTSNLERSGSLAEWQSLIGIAQHSTAMIVSLGATFGAPLLFLVARPSFGVVLQAPSRKGKTTAQVVGASPQGFGRSQDLPTLNSTPAGLLALAKETNDHALFIDEIGAARGPKRDIYVGLRDSTYALMSGRDVLRHPSWIGAAGDGPSTFRVIVVLSSEHSPDTWAARNGQTRDEGETARLISLPLSALGESIFDRPPPTLTGSDLAVWESGQLARLHEELPGQRGVAFGQYLDAITRRPRATTERAREIIARLETKLASTATSPVARDIVAKFGVLLAGGIIARDEGILPISKLVIGKAIMKACRAALSALPDPRADLRRDLALLKERLSGGGILDGDRLDSRFIANLSQADGFKRRRGNGWEYVIRAQIFAGWFATPAQVRATLDHLAEEGYLQLARSASLGRSNAWAQNQALWPDGTRPRSITIFLPRGLGDLTVSEG